MKVYFQAPSFINNSSHLQHLIEHCIVSGIVLQRDVGFKFRRLVGGSSSSYCIELDFGGFNDIDTILKIISNLIINKKIVQLELKSMREELKGYGKSRLDLIEEHVRRVINKHTENAYIDKKLTNIELVNYLSNHKRIDYCIIEDTEQNIKYVGSGIINKHFPRIGKKNTWEKQNVSKKGKQFTIIRKKIDSFFDIRIITFLEYLFDGYSYFAFRILKGEYFNPDSCKYHLAKHVAFTCHKGFLPDVLSAIENESTFNKFKEGFLFDLQHGVYKKIFVDFLLLYGLKSNMEQVTDLINGLRVKDMQEIFRKSS